MPVISNKSRPEQTAMENAINVSLLSMFLQKLKISFTRWPSCYAQWEAHSEKLEKHLSLVYSVTKMWNQVGNEAMCKDVSCFTYNDQTSLRHMNVMQSF